MDDPLLKLSEASGITVNEDCEWPPDVEREVADFLESSNPKALFVVEQNDGLVIGPPPSGARDEDGMTDKRVVVVAKRQGALDSADWVKKVASMSVPLEEGAIFQYLHALVSQACIPLFDSAHQPAAANARNRFVETERALAALLTNSEIALPDLVGSNADKIESMLNENDINELQNLANTWKSQISELASSDRDPRSTTASDEIAFWFAFKAALTNVKEQLNSEIVRNVFNKLEEAKRFHATHDFAGETGLDAAIEKVDLVTQNLFKDLPLGLVLAANDFDQLDNALQAVFQHLQKKLKQSNYGAKKGVGLVEVIGKDFARTLSKLIDLDLELLIENYAGDKNVVTLAMSTNNLLEEVEEVCDTWETLVRDYIALTRDLMRKNQERFSVVKVQSSHLDYLARLRMLDDLTAQHAELLPLVAEDEDLQYQFNEILDSQPILKVPDAEWQKLRQKYSKAAYNAETTIATDLEQQLEAANGNVNQLIKVFEEHKQVLTRVRVRVALHPFQALLLDQARLDLKQAKELIPQVPCAKDDIVNRVVLVRQIKLRLEQLKSRLAVILGNEWRAHAEGAQIASDIDTLAQQLDLDTDVKQWSNSFANSSSYITNNENSTVLSTQENQLVVRGSLPQKPQEARSLQALGFPLAPQVHASMEKISRFYGMFQQLQTSLSTLESVCEALRTHSRVTYSTDVCQLGKSVIEYIFTGLTTMTWSSDDLNSYITDFCTACDALDQRVLHLSISDSAIDKIMISSADVTSKKEQVGQILENLIAPGYTEIVENELSAVIDQELSLVVSKHFPSDIEMHIDLTLNGINVVPGLDAALQAWLDELNDLIKDLKLPASNNFINCYSQSLDRIWIKYAAYDESVSSWVNLNWIYGTNMIEYKESLRSLDNEKTSVLIEKIDSLKTGIQGIEKTDETKIEVTCKTEVLDTCTKWIKFLQTELSESIGYDTTPLTEKSIAARSHLESQPFNNTSKLVESLANLQLANDILKEMTVLNPIVSKAQIALDCSDDLPFTKELRELELVCEKWTRTKKIMRSQLSKALEHDCATLFGDFKSFEVNWAHEKPLSEKTTPKDALRLLDSAATELKSFDEKVSVLENAFSCLPSSAPTSLTTISGKVSSLLEETLRLQKGYGLLSALFLKLKYVMDIPFFETSCSDIHDAIDELTEEEAPGLAAELKSFQHYKRDVDMLRSCLPVVDLLKSSASWSVQQMETLLNRSNSNSYGSVPNRASIMLKHLVSSHLDISDVKKAVEASEGEFQLREYLRNIITNWQSQTLEVNTVILNLDVYLELANDNLAALSAMRSSTYFANVSVLVRQTEGQLKFASVIFDLLIDTQQLYMQLRSLLLSEQIALVLPNECKSFNRIENQIQGIFSKAKDAIVLDFVGSSRLQDTLSSINEELNKLHKSLAGFLETQRNRCPRLYFVGDDDVLEIMALPLSVWAPKLLNLLFPGVQNLKLENETIFAVSKEGEELELDIDCSVWTSQAHQDAIMVINMIEDTLKSALSREIKKSCMFFKKQFTANKAEFELFLEQTPLQASVIGLRTYWTENPKSDAFDVLLDIVPHMGDSSLLWSRRKEAIAVELNYFKSARKICINYAYDTDLKITIGPHQFEYGYEYLGCPEMAVRTTVTENLFLSAAIALAQSSGLSIAGPAGTGKTETVKALGNLIGRRVIVFNCDDEFDSKFVVRAVHGAAKTKSWVCFDEFNRLPKPVLSGITPILADKVRETPVFVTMNPGYAGRSVLPSNMRAQFREFWLNKPDTLEIARVLLNSQGKNDQDAECVVELLAELSSKLDKQRHYDWGLRALKAVLKAMKALEIDSKEACKVILRPRLLPNDRNIFDSIIANETQKTTSDEMIDLLKLSAGLITLGPPRSGKSSLIARVAKELNAEVTVCDPSAMDKHSLIGRLDYSTREWEDGLISSIIRRVVANRRQEETKYFFIVFDGEVESHFAEALNSVLDETKQLTLPTGELIAVPQNIKFIFETTNLDSATLATISRCAVLCTERSWSTDDDSDLIAASNGIEHVFPTEVRDITIDLGSTPLSLVWKYAGDSNEEGRRKITEVLRKKYDLDNIEDLTAYKYDGQYKKFHSDAIQLPHDAVERADIVVPTVETCANEYVLAEALKQGIPLLLVGPPGSGKTMTLLNALRATQDLDLVALSLGVKSGPELIIQALELHCNYSYVDKKCILSPPGSTKLALFLDELNLPVPSDANTAPILQLLRGLIEHNGFFNKKGQFVHLERVQFVGACNPPPDRRPLPSRLLPLWFVISVNYPSKDSLIAIYNAYLSTFGARKCCEPMINAYLQLRSELPNEIWTPRELTRWTRGLFAAKADKDISDDLLAHIFVYEGARVLADKLSADNAEKVKSILRKEANSVSQTVFSDDIWSNLISRTPEFVSLKNLSLFIQSRLEVFADEAAYDSDKMLVAHSDFIIHVTRIIRILQQPQGHLLLKGPPAVGKNTAVRFSCWLLGIHYSSICGHSQYSEEDFAADLRQTVLDSLSGPIVLIMNDTLLKCNAFVERTNALLANGETPALFSTPEQQSSLEKLAKKLGCTSSGSDAISKWVRQRVVSNLHAIFVTEDENMILSPALLNRCTVNIVEPWTEVTREQIAKHWCQTIDVPLGFIKNLVDLPVTSGSRFIELCHQFVNQYTNSKKALEVKQRRLVSGSDCLKLTVLETQQLKQTLSLQQKQLEKETKRSSEVLTDMLARQSEAERKRVAAAELRNSVQRQTEQIEKRQEEADRKLSTALPFIKQAKEGVKNIRKSQLNELRALNNPPEVVKMALESVCLVLSLPTDKSWRQVLTQIRGDEFIPRIVNFDNEKLDKEIVRKVKTEYMTRPEFTYERVDRASKAAGPLLRWVVAQICYADALAAVAPLQTEVRKLDTQAKESRAQLNEVETMMLEFEESINTCKKEYSNAVAHCEMLKSEMNNNSIQLKRAQNLLLSLNGEQVRWQQSSLKFNELLGLIPNDSLLRSTQLVLCGALDSQQRRALMKSTSEMLQVSSNSTTVQYSNDDIVHNSFSPVLVIDPNGQEFEKLAKEGASITSFVVEQSQMLKQVDAALRFGQHLIVQHAERFDTLLMPLVEKEFTKKGARCVVQIKGQEIDVSPEFKLTLYTRDLLGIEANAPTLLSLTTVVNYTITSGAFQTLVSDALIKSTMPDLAKRRLTLKKIDEQTKTQIESLEQELLDSLSKRSDSNNKLTLLHDQKLIESLEKVKKEAEALAESRKSALDTLKELDEAYSKFKPQAVQAAGIYDKTKELMNIDSFYSLSSDWLCQIAKKCALEEIGTESRFVESFDMECGRRVASVMRTEDRLQSEFKKYEPLPLSQLVQETVPNVPILAGLSTVNTDDPGPNLASHGTILAADDGDKLDKQFMDCLVRAMESDTCVVVQNVEVASDEWLKQLNRKLSSSHPHPKFRLVLTGLLDDVKIIPDLVATTRPVCVERIQGIRNCSRNACKLVKASKSIEFAVCFVHSKLCEQFKSSLFGQADLGTAIYVANSWSSESVSEILSRAVYGPRSDPAVVETVVQEAFEMFKDLSVDECEDLIEELPDMV